MNKSITLFLVLVSKIIFSQTIYTIPWAIQQPKFVFPIFIEDGVGNRDTLYLGYDLHASQNSFDTADQNFGVIKTPIDTNLFYAMWDVGNLHCGTSLCTEVYKANVCSLNIDGFFPKDATIFCNNGVMPLKFSWDKSLFYSDSLPFLDFPPAPRGWGRITGFFSFCGQRENFMTIIDQGGFFIVSDSLGQCRDSVTYFPFNGQPQSTTMGYIGFKIEQWNSPTNINSISNENYFTISSLENSITISSLKEEITISVYDLIGKEYLSRQIKSSESFQLPSLQANLYLLVINNNHFKKTLKIFFYE